MDCKEVLKKTLLNLKSSIDENNAVITKDGLPVITGNKNQLVKLFQNLIGNSIKYRDVENPNIHISAQKKKGKWRDLGRIKTWSRNSILLHNTRIKLFK